MNRGFHVLERNFTCRGGEIDLVCEDRDTLVFIEVRARRDGRFGGPAATISSQKRQRLIHAARIYLASRHEERACRFDVVAIEGGVITHLQNAFETEDPW
jgi:putative endonuclease